MSRDTKQNELGIFLKARRAERTPRQVGLIDSAGPRRVSGLRPEEVAQLASISTDYYTRIEQGRIQVSAPVLGTLADVLKLDDDQRRYLFSLAGKLPTRPARQTAQKVKPQLQRLLADLTLTPAIVMGRRMDVLAWNDLAAAMTIDFGQVPPKQRNYVTSLVGELSVQDPQFSQWWAARNVASLSTGTKTLVHPTAGELVLDWDTLVEAADADQQLVVWTAEPGSATYEALRALATEL